MKISILATELTAAVVRELLDYDPDTGALIWRHRARQWFATDAVYHTWNGRRAGQPAFTAIGNHGYFTGAIFYRNYLAHRVIWLYMTGRWPRDQIDHVNHERTDNRWCNLRAATHQQNARNVALPRNNRSGRVGVRSTRNGKFDAEIVVGGRNIRLGRFVTFTAAAAARRRAERRHGFAPTHGQARLRLSQAEAAA